MKSSWGFAALAFVALVCFGFGNFGAQAQFQPIPSVYDGYSIGTPLAPIWLEAYFDFLCPDSAASWPIIKQVIGNYTTEQIWFRLHAFPLVFHHNAFIAAKTGLIIFNNNPDAFWPWVDTIFDPEIQSGFYNTNTTNITMTQVIENFAALVSQDFDVPVSEFLDQMNNNQTIEYNARVAWKYGCGRGVFGTPTFFINGVLTQADETWTYSQWDQLLQEVIGGQDPMFLRTRLTGRPLRK